MQRRLDEAAKREADLRSALAIEELEHEATQKELEKSQNECKALTTRARSLENTVANQKAEMERLSENNSKLAALVADKAWIKP